MRCFIAIDVPGEVKRAISEVIGKVRDPLKGMRWVPTEGLHVTLKFLGTVRDDMLSQIEKALSDICAVYQPFSASVRGTGAFPGPTRPNVVWAGMEEPGEMGRLASDIDEAMHRLGFEREERRFSPHLTIGRVKDRRGIDRVMKDLATFKDTFFGTINIEEILLMRSDLKPSGAEYTKVAGFKLKNTL